MTNVVFTQGLKEKLDADPEVSTDFDDENLQVNYIDRNTGEILLSVETLTWERMEK